MASLQRTPVVDTTASRHAVLRPVPIVAVRLETGFWRPRMEANRKAGIPAFLKWLERDEQTAPFPAFARAEASGDDSLIAPGLEALAGCWEGRNKQRLMHHKQQK